MRPEGLSQLKTPSHPIENRNRNLLVCSAMPQSTATPRTPRLILSWQLNRKRMKCAWHEKCMKTGEKYIYIYKNVARIPRNISLYTGY